MLVSLCVCERTSRIATMWVFLWTAQYGCLCNGNTGGGGVRTVAKLSEKAYDARWHVQMCRSAV